MEHGKVRLCQVQTPPTVSPGWAGARFCPWAVEQQKGQGTGKREMALLGNKLKDSGDFCPNRIPHTSIILGCSWRNYIQNKPTPSPHSVSQGRSFKGGGPLNMQATRFLPEFQGCSLLFFLFFSLVHMWYRTSSIWGLYKAKVGKLSEKALGGRLGGSVG